MIALVYEYRSHPAMLKDCGVPMIFADAAIDLAAIMSTPSRGWKNHVVLQPELVIREGSVRSFVCGGFGLVDS